MTAETIARPYQTKEITRDKPKIQHRNGVSELGREDLPQSWAKVRLRLPCRESLG